MGIATVSSKGQITLPARVRTELGIRKKDKVQFLVRDGELVIKPLRSFRELRGILSPKKGDPRKAAREAAAKHVMEPDQ
jgi:antitoxin PrlF